VPRGPDPQLLRSFRFQVKLIKSAGGEAGGEPQPPTVAPLDESPGDDTQLGDGAFQECTGLEVEQDVQEYLEGGRNDGVIRRVGRAKYQQIVLKRGMMFSGRGPVDNELWAWLQSVVSGTRPVRRYDGIVEVMDVGPAVVARWVFARGLPAKVSGPQLNARTGEVAIEELHIAHEGMRLAPI